MSVNFNDYSSTWNSDYYKTITRDTLVSDTESSFSSNGEECIDSPFFEVTPITPRNSSSNRQLSEFSRDFSEMNLLHNRETNSRRTLFNPLINDTFEIKRKKREEEENITNPVNDNYTENNTINNDDINTSENLRTPSRNNLIIDINHQIPDINNDTNNDTSFLDLDFDLFCQQNKINKEGNSSEYYIMKGFWNNKNN